MRSIRALFAWKTVFYSGFYCYQENSVTGKRRAVEAHAWTEGWAPRDVQWLEGGERSKLPTPPKQRTIPKPIFLGEGQRLKLAPDDIIVLTLPGNPSHEAIERARSFFADQFGADRKVIVLVDGVKIGVLAPEAA